MTVFFRARENNRQDAWIVTLAIVVMMLAGKGAAAAPASEALIRLQIASLKPTEADTVHAVGVDPTLVDNQRWVERSERALTALMARQPALAERLKPGQWRRDLLQTIFYESRRSGLDPDLVLAVVRAESNFRKYAISSAGAMGYMQVMPFWADTVGVSTVDLFNAKTNLRLGCAILRLYLEQEQFDIARALARYNGSTGSARYSNYVFASWLQ